MKHQTFKTRLQLPKSASLRAIYVGFTCLVLLATICNMASGEEWTTYLHDNSRSGITSEQLKLPLREVWIYESKHAPQPAWPAPAKRDGYHRIENLRARVTFDRAFHVAVVDNAVYFGSSADDKVYSLDATTGAERWSVFTDAPIRLAPSVSNGKIYVGSDDGWVYCLATTNGALLWKYKPASDDYRVPGNGRMMSVWPVRTGVLVDGDIAYCCAGLFPSEGAYLCALNANDGSELWKKKLNDLSPQGYLLASATRLYVPTGRGTPAVFDRRDGKRLGTLGGAGGTYALLAADMLIYGPGKTGQLEAFNANTKDRIVTFGGLQMIVTDEMSYLHTDKELSALDRVRYLELIKQKKPTQECIAWKQPCQYPYSLILAGDVLFAGGNDMVVAFSATDGKLLWTGTVAGKAYGLAVANAHLFVSTDKGKIHCFGEWIEERRLKIED